MTEPVYLQTDCANIVKLMSTVGQDAYVPYWNHSENNQHIRKQRYT